MTTYRIRTVSKITGIPSDTIRNWEKRYDFLKPSQGKNGEKIYSDEDITLLRKISTMLKGGGRISEIAAQVLSGEVGDLGLLSESRVSNEVKLMIEDYYQLLIDSDLKKIDQMESLIEITVIFKNRIDYIYYPILEKIRENAAKGTITTAQESFATGHILNKLKGFLSTSIFKYNSETCPIICASPSNAIYEAGMLALACSLKLNGHNIYYLGPNIAVSHVKDFAKKIQNAVLAISIHDPSELDLVIKTFQNESFPVCVGGIGVRLSDHPVTKIGQVHLISYTGASAIEKVETICISFLESLKKQI